MHDFNNAQLHFCLSNRVSLHVSQFWTVLPSLLDYHDKLHAKDHYYCVFRYNYILTQVHCFIEFTENQQINFFNIRRGERVRVKLFDSSIPILRRSQVL